MVYSVPTLSVVFDAVAISALEEYLSLLVAAKWLLFSPYRLIGNTVAFDIGFLGPKIAFFLFLHKLDIQREMDW